MCELKQYIADHFLDVYLEDAINKILQSDNRVDQVDDFLRDYFSKVNTGEHVNNADGRYVLASPYNRACVVRQLQRYLKPIDGTLESQLAKGDYCSIIEVNWPHWDSRAFVQRSITRFLDRSQVSFPTEEFIRAFALSILYEDFLREMDTILLSNKSYSRNRILYKIKERRSNIEALKSLWPSHSVVEESVTEDCSFEDFNKRLMEISKHANFVENLCESA